MVRAFCRFGLAVALFPACRIANLTPPVGITIVKEPSKIGYSFLAYLDLWQEQVAQEACPDRDVTLCWKQTEFLYPSAVGLGECYFHPGYVYKVLNVEWEYMVESGCGWDEEVEFLRRTNSPSPRAVHAHLTPKGDPTKDLDEGDDRIHDP